MSRVRKSGNKWRNDIKHTPEEVAPSRIERYKAEETDYTKARTLSSWLFLKYDMSYQSFRKKSKEKRNALKEEYERDTSGTLLQSFIDNNDIEYTKNLISKDDLQKVSEIAGVQIGEQLEEYILKYGYLAFSYRELYGINSVQMMDSDMIKQTVYLHEYFPETKEYIAIEHPIDGLYYIIDKNDYIYTFETISRSIIPINKKLFRYILYEFKQILNF